MVSAISGAVARTIHEPSRLCHNRLCHRSKWPIMSHAWPIQYWDKKVWYKIIRIQKQKSTFQTYSGRLLCLLQVIVGNCKAIWAIIFGLIGHLGYSVLSLRTTDSQWGKVPKNWSDYLSHSLPSHQTFIRSSIIAGVT